MTYIGDYAEDYATLNYGFTTINPATGAPFVLAGSPVISVYKGSATGTEKTSAESYITLSVDFDSVVGLNNVLIDLSGNSFFETGEDYKVIITTGTVNSVSVVGIVLFTFSIENRFNANHIDTVDKRLGLLLVNQLEHMRRLGLKNVHDKLDSIDERLDKEEAWELERATWIKEESKTNE